LDDTRLLSLYNVLLLFLLILRMYPLDFFNAAKHYLELKIDKDILILCYTEIK
jgi:hypothetical protein